MPKPLSLDLRQRIVDAGLDRSLTYEDLAQRFSVGRASVSRYLRRQREEGSVAPKPATAAGREPRITDDQKDILISMVSEHSDATAAELADLWVAGGQGPVTRSSMIRALQRFGITLKKNVPSDRADEKRKHRRTERVSGHAARRAA